MGDGPELERGGGDDVDDLATVGTDLCVPASDCL